jgi:hypothetical protein
MSFMANHWFIILWAVCPQGFHGLSALVPVPKALFRNGW